MKEEQTVSETFSIFILKSQAGTLAQAENFLKNRNWIVGNSTNLREALAYIIQKKPQYVFLSADHPNKKVRMLPKMLSQAFPVKVIGFAEKSTGLSQKQLNEMALEYNLYPPVSGPAIERIILKIKKDEEVKAQQAANPKSRDGAVGGGDDTITFKGDSVSGEDLKASFESARAALSQLVGGDDDGGPAMVGGSGHQTSGSGQQDGSGSFVGGFGNQQGHQGDFNSDGFRKDSGMIVQKGLPESSVTNDGAVIQKGNSHQAGAAYMGQMGAKASGPNTSQEGPGEGESFDAWAERMRKAAEMNAAQEGVDPADLQMPQHPSQKNDADDTSNWEGLTPEEQAARRRGKAAPIMESEHVPKKAKKEYTIKGSRHEDLSNQSIIVRGAQNALDETVNLKDEDVAQAVEKASNIACITVSSPKFNGYLVCAMGKNRKMDKSMIDTIQKRLSGFLRANGETISEKDTMDMKIQEVDFTDWALEQAEFLRRSVHDGDEIAMAFFPTNDLEVALEDSASEKMLKMSLDDLKADVALEFDLYIYMPENNKYLLYTPEGQPFYGDQKGRLKDKGINHMHLRKDNSHNVKKYKAQNFLNEKIEAFKMAQKIKAGTG